MVITVKNISTKIKDADFQPVISAIGEQIARDFHPEWDIAATLRGVTSPLTQTAHIQGQHNAIIYFGDSHQDPTTGVEGALGYHSVNHANLPYGFVYLDITEEYGEKWSVTLSHEALELLGDPDAAETVVGPAPNNGAGQVYYDLDLCDPTQGDSYKIGDVDVSNFVGRAYFALTGGTGSTNYLQLPLDAFGVRPGGYFQYEVNGTTQQVQGSKVTQRMLAAKKKLEFARRNNRRLQRLHRGGRTPTPKEMLAKGTTA